MRAYRARQRAEREAQVEAERKRPPTLFQSETLDLARIEALDFDEEALERWLAETERELEELLRPECRICGRRFDPVCPACRQKSHE